MNNLEYISKDKITELQTCTKNFLNHVYHIQQSFGLIPDSKNHYGVCINYVDLQETRNEFCKELVNTISEWIYSQKKAKIIIDKLKDEGRSELNALSAFQNNAFAKFRNREGTKLVLQGQFGELLLFNFLQCFYSAIPILRKMPITTSIGMERFGADAIHYNYENNKHKLYLGEAKTYSSNYKFSSAIEDGIKSVIKSYDNHRSEMSLYIYDDFIDEEIEKIAIDYKNSTLKDVEVHLVIIISYNETDLLTLKEESQIKTDIIKIIEKKIKKLDANIYKAIREELHLRFNYIIFPIWKLDELILQFQKLIGV